ncbi:MAG TPA: hypothetical protein DDW78_08875 [Treponema sp.]|nr:hypothetical protein [Treponema sp.]
MKKIITLAAAFAALLWAGSSSALSAQGSGKNLIVYFSLYGNQKSVLTDADSGASRTLYEGKVRGNTEIIARMIQESVGGDLVLLETENKFSDGYNAVIEEGKHSKSTKFKATKNKIDLSQYDAVFIGFPAW